MSEDNEVNFESFAEIDFGPLPNAVTIVQDHQDTFQFQFVDIRLNDPGFNQKTD